MTEIIFATFAEREFRKKTAETMMVSVTMTANITIKTTTMKKATLKKCSHCKKQAKLLKRYEQRTSWFRGEDEVHNLCSACYMKRFKLYPDAIDEKKLQDKEDAVEFQKKVVDPRRQEILDLEKQGYTIKPLTIYQYRINGVLDLYPTSSRYHFIKTGARGFYTTALKAVSEFIEGEVSNEDPEEEEWVKKERQFERIAELVKQGYTSGHEADFYWELTVNQL